MRTGERTRTSAGIALVMVLAGVLAVAMSISGTAVAVPEIGRDLRASGSALQWVVAAYNLMFAAFTLVCGSLADLVGRRTMFRVGAVLFAGAAMVSALAPTILVLDLGRAVAGVGGAAVMASGGAILATTFEGATRTRAFAALGTMAGVGIALGPSISGWMIGGLGWRLSFLAYVGIGVLILVGSFAVAESRRQERPSPDVLGMVLFVAGLALVMVGVLEGPESGWSPPVLVALFGGVLLMTLFVLVERRRTAPVLDLALVGNRRFLAWCLATLATSVGFLGALVFLPTYLQGASGMTVGTAGVVMLLLTGPVLLVPPIGGWLVNRGLPGRWVMTVALLSIAVGNGWLTVLRPDVPVAVLVGPLLAIGIGMGLSFGITDGQAMAIVEPARAGMAAGFLNTVRGGAEALVIAAFGAALLGLLRTGLGSAELAGRVLAGDLGTVPRPDLAAAYTESWHLVLWTVSALTAVAAVVVYGMLAKGRSVRPGTST